MAAPDHTEPAGHVVAAIVAAVAFVGVALFERRVGVAGWERSTTRWCFELPDSAGALLRPANELGNRAVAVVIAGAVAWRRTVRAGLVVLAAAGLAWALASIGKAVVDRPRVSAAELGGPARQVVHDASFPSSHVAVATAVAVTVALVVPGRWRWVLAPIAVLTAIARMWLGVHLPLDLVGGALLGTSVAFAAAATAEAFRPAC